MANIGPFSIRFDQRKSDNTAYKEKYVSGSNLIIITDTSGEVTGSKIIQSATITELSSSTTNFGSIILNGISKFFDKIYAYAGIVGDLTGSISGSTVIANSANFTSLTASSILGLINSASYAENSNLLDGRDSTTFAGTSSNIFIGDQIINGSVIADSGSFTKLFLNNSSSAPLNSTDAGTSGEIRIDDNFMYIYTGNVWNRIPKNLWN